MRPRPPFASKVSNPAHIDASRARRLERDTGTIARPAPGHREMASRIDLVQTAHGLSVGMAVRHSGTAWVRALGLDFMPPLGVVVEVYGPDACAIALSGSIRYPTALTAGTVYYPTDSGSTYVTTTRSLSGPLFVATGTDTAVLLTRPKPIAEMPKVSATPAMYAGERLFARTRSWSRYVVSSTTYVVHAEAEGVVSLSADGGTFQAVDIKYLVWGYTHNSSTGAMSHDGQSGGLSSTPFSAGGSAVAFATLFGQSNFVRIALSTSVYSPPANAELAASIDYDAGTKTVRTQSWLERWS